MPASADVIVVGGGALGCASALELAKRGLAVTVIERDSVGSHASGSAYGGLYATTGVGIPGPILPLAKQAVERHVSLAEELRETTGIDTALRAACSLDVALDDAGMAELAGAAEWQRREGFDVELIEAGRLHDFEQSLTSNLAGGALQRSHFEIDSYRYTLALASALEKHGGALRHGEVTSVEVSGGRVSGVRLASREFVPAGAVVLAQGPWAGEGALGGVPALPIRPLKGEILRLRFPGEGFKHRVVVQNRYIARKPDGLVWVGTTQEEAGFDDRPSTAARDSILSGVLRLAPALESAEVVQHTACLRPMSSDGMPIVGPIGDDRGVYVVNGAGSKGILLSPVMASMAAAVVTDPSAEAEVPSAFSSLRFG